MKPRQAGFTLIEFLVVIAIIGILAYIILASLGTARQSSLTTKVESQMDSMQKAGELYYSTNYNYGSPSDTCGATPTGMFADSASNMANLTNLGSYPNGTTLVCNTSGTAWAASANLPNSTSFWCVDNIGESKSENAQLGAGVTQCP